MVVLRLLKILLFPLSCIIDMSKKLAMSPQGGPPVTRAAGTPSNPLGTGKRETPVGIATGVIAGALLPKNPMVRLVSVLDWRKISREAIKDPYLSDFCPQTGRDIAFYFKSLDPSNSEHIGRLIVIYIKNMPLNQPSKWRYYVDTGSR